MSEAVVEAVILTGPRRGDIVKIDLDGQETWSEEDARRVAMALKELDEAFAGLLNSTRQLEETVRTAADRMIDGERSGNAAADRVQHATCG